MKQYNVALNKGVDYDAFWNDMESATDGGKLYIPNRAVKFTNERPASLRQCWYLLTEEEAELIREDDRVYCVEIPPELRSDIIITPSATQTGDFTKTTSDGGAFTNWGLIRSSNSTNVYGTGTTTELDYTYTLDGTGVDIVIQDSGLQPDHPEFQDSTGNNRLLSINWGSYSGGGFIQNVNHNRDFDGHGTHVAGIAAGKTYGWAKNARMYSQKLAGLEGPNDSGTGISVTYAFDSIKTWHNSKAGSRPTIVNMSWGYLLPYNSVTSLTYRGISYNDANTTGNASYRNANYGLVASSGGANATYATNIRIGSVDIDLQEMIDAGIIVCTAAGNRSHKIDIIGGTDYNNFVVTDSGTVYYHRGSSPHEEDAISVGSMDSVVYDATFDQKATYSETGPGVDVYAPGTNIMSSTSNVNTWGAGSQNYHLNSSYKQTNISGTSMASPQVAGVAALILQLNPSYTPLQVKTSILAQSTSTIFTVSNIDNDWANSRTLNGGSQDVLYANYNLAITRPFTRNVGASISGTEQLANLAIGVFQQEYAKDLGGIKWWMGPDENLGYIVTKEVPSGTQPNPVSSNQATVAFLRSLIKTELSFVEMVNGSFGQNFTTGNQAKTWLNSNGYWTSWGAPSEDQFTIYFDVTASPTTGWSSQALACAGTGTPLTVYITGNAASLHDAVVTQGKALYTNSGRTTLLNGSNTWYKTVSAPATGEVFQVGSAGETSLWGGAC